MEPWERPVLKYTIRGRPDLIRIDEMNVNVERFAPHLVKYALEIKPSSEMKAGAALTRSIKEGILNLIGLNVDNSSASPPVVVTDLNERNHVLYLEMASTDPLSYKVCNLLYDSFAEAITYVESMSTGCCTRDFGCPCSAISTENMIYGGVVISKRFLENNPLF